MTDKLDFNRMLTDPEYEPTIYYARDGEPLTQKEWTGLFGSINDEIDYRRIGQDYVDDLHGRQHHVSTVWLGLDHGFGPGPPVIFETMIFCHDHICRLNDSQWRYCTESEAEEGHARAVALVQETDTPLGVRIMNCLSRQWELCCFWGRRLRRKMFRQEEPFWDSIRTYRMKRRKRIDNE